MRMMDFKYRGQSSEDRKIKALARAILFAGVIAILPLALAFHHWLEFGWIGSAAAALVTAGVLVVAALSLMKT